MSARPIDLEALRNMNLNRELVDEMPDTQVTELLLGLKLRLPGYPYLRIHTDDSIKKMSTQSARDVLFGVVSIANGLDTPVRR